MTRPYAEYMERARALLDAGFSTKQARKDALDYVSRAFDHVRDEIHNALLSEERTEANNKLYWSVPDCHAWKAKHAAMFARFPAAVEKGNACAALRASIKAAPTVEKKPSARQAALAVERSRAKTCQICERAILAETGLIAHHGYERPGDGWQTASCFGARALPFEVSRDRLGEYVDALARERDRLREKLAAVSDETRPSVLHWRERSPVPGREQVSKNTEVTRATFDAKLAEFPAAVAHYKWHRAPLSFDVVKSENVASIGRKYEHFREEHTRQKRRYDGWKPVETKS